MWKSPEKETQSETPCLNKESGTSWKILNKIFAGVPVFISFADPGSLIFLYPSQVLAIPRKSRGRTQRGWGLWKVPCFGKSQMDTLLPHSVLPSIWKQKEGPGGLGRPSHSLFQEPEGSSQRKSGWPVSLAWTGCFCSDPKLMLCTQTSFLTADSYKVQKVVPNFIWS